MTLSINGKTYEAGELIAYVKQLEKENTELKEQNKSYEQLIDTGSVTLMKDRLKNYKQLTKAEEIIRTLYFIIQGRIDYEDNIQIKDSMDLARAFLNEVK